MHGVATRLALPNYEFLCLVLCFALYSLPCEAGVIHPPITSHSREIGVCVWGGGGATNHTYLMRLLRHTLAGDPDLVQVARFPRQPAPK